MIVKIVAKINQNHRTVDALPTWLKCSCSFFNLQSQQRYIYIALFWVKRDSKTPLVQIRWFVLHSVDFPTVDKYKVGCLTHLVVTGHQNVARWWKATTTVSDSPNPSPCSCVSIGFGVTNVGRHPRLSRPVQTLCYVCIFCGFLHIIQSSLLKLLLFLKMTTELSCEHVTLKIVKGLNLFSAFQSSGHSKRYF